MLISGNIVKVMERDNILIIMVTYTTIMKRMGHLLPYVRKLIACMTGNSIKKSEKNVMLV
jgi:hypothetical protein